MRLALCTALLLTACQATPPLPWDDSADGVANAELAQLCRDAWEDHLSSHPQAATAIGDPRYHGKLSLPSPETAAQRAATVERFRERALGIPESTLDPRDAITRASLLIQWDLALAEHALAVDFDSWQLDPLYGPQARFLTSAQDQPVETRAEQRQLLERWRRIPAYMDQVTANLQRGLANGRVASYTSVTKVLGQVDALLATPPASSPLYTCLPEHTSPGLRDEVLAVVRDEIYPAFARHRAVLAERVLPNARDDLHPGLGHVAGGPEAYRHCIRRETSLELEPEEIHAIGLAEIARIRAEISVLGQRVFGTSEVAEIQHLLRTSPEMHFTTREEVEQKAQTSLARAREAMSSAFGILPRADCIVVRTPPHEEADSTIAYYNGPSADGSRPGRYFINTSLPKTRPRYEAEVLAYHEAIPGHHLQIAIAQELDGVPMIRRYTGGSTAFVEGWALYTERLCDELGLYSGDVDRLGVLSFDAWRASRLVVDTGLHALGWTRQQAIDYMTENTLLAENNIANEVDRYIAWPGQALAYKLGQREILALREQAREALGNQFELSGFHDRVLENGAVTLSILRDQVEAWIAAGAARP